MDYVESVDGKVSLKITGEAMESSLGFELKYLLNLLDNIENLIEKTYLFSDGRERMKSEDYDNLKILLNEPKKGSFKAEIFIQVASSVLPVVPLIAQDGLAIWSSIKQAYEYLKILIDTRKDGEKMNITQKGDGLIVTGDNNSFYINKNIPGLAEKIAPYIANMAKEIDGEKIEGVDLLSNRDLDIKMTPQDRERYKVRTFLNVEYSEYEGKIVSSDSMRDSGEIETSTGLFTYEIHESIATEKVHDSIYLKEVRLKCRERVRIDPAREPMEEVLSLEVYDFKII